MQVGKIATSLISTHPATQFNPNVDVISGQAGCEGCGLYKIPVITLPKSGKTVADRFCEDCRAEARAIEKEKKKAIRLANIEDLLARCGVPKRFQSCTVDNYQGYKRLGFTGRPAFITGPAGTGKTHLAVAFLAQALVEHGEHHGHFLVSVELFLKLRDSFNKDSTIDEEGILRVYQEVPLLVLDDLGAEKVSDYVRQSLYYLINKRYGDCQDTIITSNLSLEEIGNTYGDRLASRIAGMGRELALKGKDRRLK